MNREIKFRGYWEDGIGVDEEWVYGFLYIDSDDGDYYIQDLMNLSESAAIEPKTIGQYTGLKDNNGVEIYEGDIVRTELGYAQIIVWSDMYAAFVAEYPNGDRPYRVDCTDEIIGNIHEDGHLLKK